MTYRVFSSQVMHETNTFSRLPTSLDSYRARMLYRGDEIPTNMRGTSTEFAAFFDAADRFGWTLVHPLAANATPSGKVTAGAWHVFSGELLRAVESEGPFDGILLALHGAMVTETTEDAEGELLAALRAKVGPQVPIVATLDLHANVTERMAANASALVTYRTYPHVDMYERGTQAAELLRRAMDGVVAPRTVIRRRDQLDGADHGRSQAGPMVELLNRAAQFETEDGILVVSINAGFPWADIREAGPSVTVTHDGRPDRAAEIADSLMDYVWETRHEKTIEHFSPDAAMAVCRDAKPGDKPIVLSDFSDNPGGGSYGDSPALLQAMIEAGLENAAFAIISDPEAVQAGMAAGEGAAITIPLGGKFDPSVAGPAQVTGIVEKLSDGDFVYEGPMFKGVKATMGPSMRLRIGGIQVVVATNRLQVFDGAYFRTLGIEPTERAVLAVKSAHHFRAAFGPMASRILLVDAAGITSPDLTRFPYENVRRPIWPLDMD